MNGRNINNVNVQNSMYGTIDTSHSTKIRIPTTSKITANTIIKIATMGIENINSTQWGIKFHSSCKGSCNTQIGNSNKLRGIITGHKM